MIPRWMRARAKSPPYLTDSKAPRAPIGKRALRLARFVLMVILPLALLVGAFAGFSYMRATRPVVPVERPVEQARLVDAVIAQRADLRPTLTLFGEIVAGRSVDLRALVGGSIVAVSDDLVDGGARGRGGGTDPDRSFCL